MRTVDGGEIVGEYPVSDANDDLFQTIIQIKEDNLESNYLPNPCGFFGRWQFWVFSALLVVIFFVVILLQPVNKVERSSIAWDSKPFNTTRSMFITMNPSDDDVLERIDIIRNKVGFDNTEIFEAVNGKTIDLDSLPLYTRYLMENGRHDHHQVSTAGMVGCYLSHIRVLEMMKPGDIFAVFEEDAHFSEDGPSEVKLLHDFIGKRDLLFDVIMIGINRVPPPSGQTISFTVGENLELIECTKDCSVWGTRGYIITYNGAQKILKHAYPIQTQIDALVSLVARYDDSFRLFWTSKDVALGPALLAIVADINYSKVQDHCLKCHLPNSNMFYLSAIPALGILVFLVIALHCRQSRGTVLAAKVDSSVNVVASNKTGWTDEDTVAAPLATASLPKLEEGRDQTQIQVPSSSVPPNLGGHCRTGSRDYEVLSSAYHRRTGSRDCDAAAMAAFSIHRRTGSRDMPEALAALSLPHTPTADGQMSTPTVWSVEVVGSAIGSNNV